MDVERTIEYILQMQAQSEVRMAKVDERMAKADERMDKFDKRLEAMRKLVETGMRMLVKNEQRMGELTVKLTVLTPEQAEYIGVPMEGPYKADHYRY